jgi:hypothetical protein
MRTPHYLSPLLSSFIPPAHAIIDTETRARKLHGQWAHRWVLGASTFGGLDSEGNWGHEWPRAATTPEGLWGEICDGHAAAGNLVVWAHNLSFDLRISEGLKWLPLHGYALEAIVLEKTAAWATFTGRAGTITVCDLHSWLPVPLWKIANDVGINRPAFKYEGATDAELEARCCLDVEATARAVGVMLEWLSRNHPGRFRPTGSGQSHAMWRRRFLPRKTVLVHGDGDALARERVAMWAGRSEAWRWGVVERPLYEHDLSLAYCRIAASCKVPVKLYGRTGHISVQEYQGTPKDTATLADVTVTTDRELVPTDYGGRMTWPVGTFNTTLWSPELDLLIAEGADVRFHRTWRYRTAPVLADMANYLIRLLESPPGEVHPIVHRLAKHWARTLVGRCALRYREWTEYGELPVMGLSLSTLYDLDTGVMTDLLHVGERVLELADMAEAETSVPQITGWVMSQARVNLWRIMTFAGLENVDYVDTDCVIVNAAGTNRLGELKHRLKLPNLVHKATYRGARIYGPRNIVLEGERRMSGIPKRAIQRGELTFDGEVWAGLRTSLEGKRPNTVAVAPRTFDVDDFDPRRERRPEGKTVPYRKD